MNALLALRSLLRPASAQPAATTLDRLARGRSAVVHSLAAPEAQAGWARQLHELGFVCGARVQLLHRSRPGGEALVVRVGASTYALRRAEAACVKLRPEP